MFHRKCNGIVSELDSDQLRSSNMHLQKSNFSAFFWQWISLKYCRGVMEQKEQPQWAAEERSSVRHVAQTQVLLSLGNKLLLCPSVHRLMSNYGVMEKASCGLMSLLQQRFILLPQFVTCSKQHLFFLPLTSGVAKSAWTKISRIYSKNNFNMLLFILGRCCFPQSMGFF